jgi:magnesium chelatase subunit D
VTDDGTIEQRRWSDAMLAAALFAVDPTGFGGIALRCGADPIRMQWLALLTRMLPASAPLRRLPTNIPDSRLLGGLDLAATLRAGRSVAELGMLREANGGVLVVAMAERLTQGTAARLATVLDNAEVVVERDGITARHPTALGVIALDEGIDEERPPEALLDRLAIHLSLRGTRSIEESGVERASDIAAARARLSRIAVDEEMVEALCEASLALGVDSLRVPLHALHVARASAALSGRDAVNEEDASVVARLVFAPRARRLPVEEPPTADDEVGGDAQRPESSSNEESEEGKPDKAEPLGDIILAAVQAAVPPEVLASLKPSAATRARSSSSGRVGVALASSRRGRPIGTRRGTPQAGTRLHVLDTLRAAAPWQAIRHRERRGVAIEGGSPRIEVRREDFHILRFKQRTESATIFVVDASGSSALNRLAEAKGAVEHLLADCYVRRDRVALISFRGARAELLLPPTRSLVRAKRGLAGLPGGGGTPLAAGIEAAHGLANALQRRGQTPTLVFLTDGRANVARDGTQGRSRAEDDSVASARLIRRARMNALLIDTSPRGQGFAQGLADEMGASYLALPYADATAVSKAVRASATARQLDCASGGS